MAPRIDTFRDLIELWPSREAMASEIGAKPSAVSKWWQRDSVPSDWWLPILATSAASKSKIKAETLIALEAGKAVEARA